MWHYRRLRLAEGHPDKLAVFPRPAFGGGGVFVVGELGLVVEEGTAAWNLAWSMGGRREEGMHQVVREVHGRSASLLLILVWMLFREQGNDEINGLEGLRSLYCYIRLSRVGWIDWRGDGSRMVSGRRRCLSGPPRLALAAVLDRHSTQRKKNGRRRDRENQVLLCHSPAMWTAPRDGPLPRSKRRLEGWKWYISLFFG